MFRTMRRDKQLLSQEQTVAILEQGTAGVLALSGDGGYPYAVPISYVYSDNKIFFHSAVDGHKIDAVKRSDKASFCVVPEEYTTYYKSVIAFGRIRILTEDSEKNAAIELLAKKYHPSDTPQGRGAAIAQAWSRMNLLELHIEHITGKAARELTR